MESQIKRNKQNLYQFFCVLRMTVARSFSGVLTIGRIAYRREGGDGSAQRGRSVISAIALCHTDRHTHHNTSLPRAK